MSDPSEINTLDFWEWSQDDSGELSVAEQIAKLGAVEVEPMGRRWRSGWAGIGNPAPPLEQRGAAWWARRMWFPQSTLQEDLAFVARSRAVLPYRGWPWLRPRKKQHHPVFRYCVYCGKAATRNILKQTYCDGHYTLAADYRCW